VVPKGLIRMHGAVHGFRVWRVVATDMTCEHGALKRAPAPTGISYDHGYHRSEGEREKGTSPR
jgi:hypothetical protein